MISLKDIERRPRTVSTLHGYVRVSTREQNEERQLIALREMAVPESSLFVDKQSGKDFTVLAVDNPRLR